MPDHEKPLASDDPVTADRKSKSIDERVPERQGPDVVPEVELPGAVGAYIPQAGVGRDPLGADMPGPGELVLEQERKAQRTPTSRG
ncbi:MAG TPA: hypothetical protein VKR80_09160 [Candidatus Limnocylindria bacterium]|nr:hypothetical protein [Candidatus Limnocylindria bacterium]